MRDICNISTDHMSENVQNKICNFEIRLEQFTNQTKKAKKYCFAGIQLSYMTMLKDPNHRFGSSISACEETSVWGNLQLKKSQ